MPEPATDTSLASEAGLRALLDAAGEGLLLWDGEGRLALCNAAARALLPELGDRLAAGAALADVLDGLAALAPDLPAERRPAWVADRLAAFARQGDDVEHRLPGGRWLRLRARPMPGGGMVLALTDIATLKAREQELAEARLLLRQTSQAKSDFIANMSHELRTPLNAIIGFAEMIRDRAFGPDALDRYCDYAADIRDSGEVLLDTINDILDLAKIEAGYMRLSTMPVDIGAVIEGAARAIRPKAQDAALNFTVTVEPGLPVIEADRRALQQVFVNLLSNAVKFTPGGGSVALAARRVGQAIEVRVSDTGIGMNPEDLPHAFAVFTQLSPSIDGSVRGTGIGLALARTLVEQHGGRIEGQTRQGHGTTMIVTLPCADAGTGSPAGQN
ncbi:MAG: hypothetical protein OHK0024_31320 [Thalassobaculales bacterium]